MVVNKWEDFLKGFLQRWRIGDIVGTTCVLYTVNWRQKNKNTDKTRVYRCFYYGAGGRTRTGTVSLPVDFESTTSANSITPAQR